MDADFAMEALARCPLFERADQSMLASFSSRLRVRRFRRNEVIMHSGRPRRLASYRRRRRGQDRPAVCRKGRRRSSPRSAPATSSASWRCSTGRRARRRRRLLSRQRRSCCRDPCSSSCLIPCRACATRSLFGVAGELRRLTGHVEELHFLDLSGRLATRLARLAQEAEPNAEGEIHLSWPYTQSDLAAMIGGTRQSVNRLLSELVDEGLVQIERDTLIITDPDELARRGER